MAMAMVWARVRAMVMVRAMTIVTVREKFGAMGTNSARFVGD